LRAVCYRQPRINTSLYTTLELDFDLIADHMDEDENILGLFCTIAGVRLLLISIYGPNTDKHDFFANLDNLIGQYQDIPVICGGDFNCTYSCADVKTNIDTFEMNNPPSINRSLWLAELCERRNLSDPFRVLNPDKLEFTYVPRAGTNNRSRIDFFIISDILIDCVSGCYISDSLISSLFDHKSISEPRLRDFLP